MWSKAAFADRGGPCARFGAVDRRSALIATFGGENYDRTLADSLALQGDLAVGNC